MNKKVVLVTVGKGSSVGGLTAEREVSREENRMTKLLDARDSNSGTGVETGLRVQAVGSFVLRYGLVLVIGWIGLMKVYRVRSKRDRAPGRT